MGWSKDQGPPTWRGDPAPFFIERQIAFMADKIISCFIDEASDFGEFETHSPFYIVTIVVHEQNHSIQSDVDTLEQYLTSLGFPNHALHTGPLIRRESVYEDMNIEERRKLFNLLFRFARKLPIQFFTVKVRKSVYITIVFLSVFGIASSVRRHIRIRSF